MFTTYSQLQVLVLCNNIISRVDPYAFAGTQISSLNLEGNLLTCTTTIHNTLKMLYLSNNQLERCQKDLPNISYPNLAVLLLDGNALTSLPAIAMTPTLKILHLENNQFSCLPDFNRLYPMLHQFTVVGNPLSCDCRVVWLLGYEPVTDLEESICHGGVRGGQSLRDVSLGTLKYKFQSMRDVVRECGKNLSVIIHG